MAKQTATKSAAVDLSQYHAGQTVQHSAAMRAEGHYYRSDTDAFGRPIMSWRADRWQAIHCVLDRSDRSEEQTASPWFRSCDEAEKWLEQRGLRLGGAYWHNAKIESAAATDDEADNDS